MKIVIFGTTGMLGRYVKTYLQKSFDIIEINRDILDAEYSDYVSTIYKLNNFCRLGEIGYAINCIGMIKPQVDKYGTHRALKVNSMFPWMLSDVFGEKLIHITTDCVFSGKSGHYDEDDEHDATDVYGKTKSLGEPDKSTVIRTSIIGEELHNSRSLVEWIKSQKGKEVNGYGLHFWNGLTCLELAKYISKIIVSGESWKGVRHVYGDAINKFDLLSLIGEVYDLNLRVRPMETAVCDRTLTSKHKLLFPVSPLKQQIEEMRNWKLEQ